MPSNYIWMKDVAKVMVVMDEKKEMVEYYMNNVQEGRGMNRMDIMFLWMEIMMYCQA